MDNQITLKSKKDAFPIASVIFLAYLVLCFIFTIGLDILNYHAHFKGMISNIIADLPTLLVTSAITLTVALLPIFKVRGPWLAIPFGIMALICGINAISAIINFFATINHLSFLIISVSVIFSLIYAAVNLIAYLLIGIAAIKSNKASKPVWATLASALFLIDALVAPVSLFIQVFFNYIGWGIMPAIEASFSFITTPYNIISMLSNLILNIIFAAGIFFLGLWMAKGKPQVEEENAIVE